MQSAELVVYIPTLHFPLFINTKTLLYLHSIFMNLLALRIIFTFLFINNLFFAKLVKKKYQNDVMNSVCKGS